MSGQAEQKTTQSGSVADMTSEEIQAEIERVDQELAQEPPPQAPSSQGRVPSSSEASGETLAREIQAVRRDLLRQYESLDSDEKYTDEYRASRQWEAYDKSRPVIEEKAKAAREKLLAAADDYELASIPFPGGQSLRTNDVQLLALAQGERSRITERLSYENPTIARMRAAGKNVPTSSEDRPVNILREEYARGLSVGGPAGGAICRAVLRLAEDRGMNIDDVVDEHRKEWQRTYLRKAQDAGIQARSLYSRVPLPSSPRPGGAKSIEEAGVGKRRSALGLKKKSTTAAKPKKKRPSWK
jgi:hypothetical protein